jgi:colanic acid/amylovoran biosynthesis glycosyltransferase
VRGRIRAHVPAWTIRRQKNDNLVHPNQRSSLTVFWLEPILTSRSTFLDRELAALRELGLDVRPVTAPLRPAALRMFLRHPIRTLAVSVELQRYKARRDRERGRLGSLVLVARGLGLAERVKDEPGLLHGTFADGVGRIAYVVSRVLERPFTFTAHSPYSLWQRERMLGRQAQAAAAVACVSEDVRTRLAELAPAARLSVVRCGGPAQAPARQSPEEPPLLLCVGTLIPHKGFATAIEGAALALAGGADLRVEVIGDGPEDAHLRTLVATLGVRDRVTFSGHRPNEYVLERLSVALAMLAPCEIQDDGDRDGLPVTLLDAAACGVPAITTAVGAIPEFVDDGITGLVVAERDPGAVANAIGRLLDDPDLVTRLGAAARERVRKQHDARREAEKLAALWATAT